MSMNIFDGEKLVKIAGSGGGTSTEIETKLEEIESLIGQSTEEIKALIEDKSANYYGFIEHMDIDNPSQRIEYIGKNKDYTPFSRNADGTMNLGSWSGYHVLANNRPAMVGNDGVPKYYLDPTNYNKKEDGTTNSDVANSSFVGDAMSWIDLVYKSENLIGKDRVVMFSQTKLNDDFLPNGFVDNGKVLSGVWIPMFYPTLISNKIRSLATGYPHVNTTAAQELTLIDAIGGQAESISGALLSTIADLMIMWAKTTNTQEVYGLGNCNGYNASDANEGVLPNQVVGGGQFYGTSDGHSANKILHSMLLGTFNVWIRDPYTICDHGVYKVSKDYAVRDLGGVGYEIGGLAQQTTGWQKEHLVVKGFGGLPSKAGGTSSTCVTGYYWINADIVAVALRLGACADGLRDGARALTCASAASNSYWYFALAFILKSPTYVS